MKPLLRLISIACFLFAALLLAPQALGAQDGTIVVIDSGGSDELQPPPSPRCNDLVFITEVSFTPEGAPIDIPRFGVGDGLVTMFDVPGFDPVGPGILVLDEVITFDGHIGRAIWDPQPNEQVSFEFLLNGVSQARTPFTPDVPDGQRTGWLDLDMGTYTLPNGADALRIHHFNNPPEIDSVVVSALCGHLEPFPEVVDATTIPPTSAAPTTLPPAEVVTTLPPAEVATTVPVTTVAPTTTTTATSIAPTTTAVSTEVLGEVEVAPQLAITGIESTFATLLALLFMMFGFGLVALSNRQAPAAISAGTHQEGQAEAAKDRDADNNR